MSNCELFEIPKEFCAHCNKVQEEPAAVYGNDDLLEFEAVGRRFQARYSGSCTINYGHSIRRGDWVTRVQRADNPMIPVSGVACTSCTRSIDHA